VPPVELLLTVKEGFLDDSVEDQEEIEREANSFAANALIPNAAMNGFVRQKPISRDQIIEFAAQVGVSPGIVVGQMQARKRLPPVTTLNKEKRKGYDLTAV
jgi:HTH-type transcriptional regulator/antitoxin HigA